MLSSKSALILRDVDRTGKGLDRRGSEREGYWAEPSKRDARSTKLLCILMVEYGVIMKSIGCNRAS